ncbi:uncharacterized protein F4822DRAFT_426909 [Hypoxylon trugodes]|uniref:uncharacterized protein n=1 Tax=Hypoxylon trugodes TaxID=326681 RepID=UPI002192E13F|nr:uncharacterized protein F4822DRAFT_426909 [Hypoxylon trugodes]KAI1391055.1 hypothetical protein F4822DRAFT_426909 [Hypoxylon trugodes]
MGAATNTNQTNMAIDAEDALRRRRERGRRSQAGFRKRQAEATQNLQEQNRRLKSAIEKLVSSTRGDEHPELLNTIFDVAEAAGIDAQRPAQQSTVNQLRPKPSGTPPILACAIDGDAKEDFTIDIAAKDIDRNAGATNSYLSDNSNSTGSDSSSPERLTCGIWLNPLHYLRVSIPPDDIIPYLGAGSQTFAGIMFWSVMDHGQNKCTRPHGDTEALLRRALSHSRVTQDWGVKYIHAMVEARQEYKSTGSISPEYAAAAEPDLAMVVCGRVEEEYYARGMDPNSYLSCVGIEKRVRRMLGEDTFKVLNTVAQGGGDPVLRDLWKMLECRLAESCVCFGDGPRWGVDVVDGLFLGWLHAASCSISL